MNAPSDPIKPDLDHLTLYVLVYPTSLEDYFFEFSPLPPQSGDIRFLQESVWWLTEVQTFQPQDSNLYPTQSFHITICTQSDQPISTPASGSILYVPVLLDTGELPTNPDDSHFYGTVIAARDVPQPRHRPFYNWQVQSLQWFEPQQPARFQHAVICWCQ